MGADVPCRRRRLLPYVVMAQGGRRDKDKQSRRQHTDIKDGRMHPFPHYTRWLNIILNSIQKSNPSAQKLKS